MKLLEHLTIVRLKNKRQSFSGSYIKSQFRKFANQRFEFETYNGKRVKGIFVEAGRSWNENDVLFSFRKVEIDGEKFHCDDLGFYSKDILKENRLLRGEMTKCWLCKRVLTSRKGERLLSAVFCSRCRKPSRYENSSSTVWAQCDRCHSILHK